jgi:hypothetical protein
MSFFYLIGTVLVLSTAFQGVQDYYGAQQGFANQARQYAMGGLGYSHRAYGGGSHATAHRDCGTGTCEDEEQAPLALPSLPVIR